MRWDSSVEVFWDTAWLELCAAGQRGEEYDWRTAELLSSLRSIEWDVQDLEDHVSIVEGNRSKFSERFSRPELRVP